MTCESYSIILPADVPTFNELLKKQIRNSSARSSCWLGSVVVSALCYRPSVCPSVARVDQSKTVQVRIMQLSPQSSRMPRFFMVNFIAKFQREHREQGRGIRGVGKICYFPPISRRISETVQDRTKVTINDIGCHICTFEWYQNW